MSIIDVEGLVEKVVKALAEVFIIGFVLGMGVEALIWWLA